jgi:hypothetical protein
VGQPSGDPDASVAVVGQGEGPAPLGAQLGPLEPFGFLLLRTGGVEDLVQVLAGQPQFAWPQRGRVPDEVRFALVASLRGKVFHRLGDDSGLVGVQVAGGQGRRGLLSVAVQPGGQLDRLVGGADRKAVAVA